MAGASASGRSLGRIRSASGDLERGEVGSSKPAGTISRITCLRVESGRRSATRRRREERRRRTAAVRVRAKHRVLELQRVRRPTSNPSASPSRTIAVDRQRPHGVNDRLAPVRPISCRLRVKTATSSPCRCTWIRAPSSFHSTPRMAGPPLERRDDVALPFAPASAPRLQRREPEVGRDRRPVADRRLRDPGRSPASIAARRTAAECTPATLRRRRP